MPSRASLALARALPPLLLGAVPLAALLSFLIQPLLGKRLLPIYGGTAGTWLGCMVFFQLALLLGYGWAAWLLRRPPLRQAAGTAALALLAVVSYHLPSDAAVGAAGIGRVVGRLSLSCLPAMVLLFSVSPLATAWLRRRGGDVPYHIYAVSNGGSLLALLLYPFVIEPRLRLSDQSLLWHALLLLVAAAVALAAWIVSRAAVDAPSLAPSVSPSAAVAPLPPVSQVAAWIGLSALTTVAMLGATYHISAEIGASPLAWVGPFGLYLLAFMVTFSGRWQRWMTIATVAWLLVSLTAYMLAKGFGAATVNSTRVWLLLSLTAAGSFLGQALLHGLRPAERPEQFYLGLAAGGVLGGLLASTVLPALLAQPLEFPLASATLLVVGLVWLNATRAPAAVALTAATVLLPLLGFGFQAVRPEPGATLLHLRDVHGHLMLKRDDASVVLSSDTTTHGTQLIADAAARRRPTQYYTESSGVGRALAKLQAQRPSLRIGVIGLGAGTLAAYARPEDTIDFWDIDPKSLRVAREHFTFVADSPGTVHLHLRDGRHALAATVADYDLIVLDAFTGDGVPSHLLTREALAIYLARLAARDGLLLVHTSTRYSKLFPIVAATARTLGRGAVSVSTVIARTLEARDWDPAPNDWVLVGRAERMADVAGWFPADEENGRVTRTVTHHRSPFIPQECVWSDDRNAALDALALDRYLFDH